MLKKNEILTGLSLNPTVRSFSLQNCNQILKFDSMDFTTKTLILFFCISMSSCSSDKGNVLDISKDTPIPKSSLADLNKNQTKNISQWDGRIKGCKSKQ